MDKKNNNKDKSLNSKQLSVPVIISLVVIFQLCFCSGLWKFSYTVVEKVRSGPAWYSCFLVRLQGTRRKKSKSPGFKLYVPGTKYGTPIVIFIYTPVRVADSIILFVLYVWDAEPPRLSPHAVILVYVEVNLLLFPASVSWYPFQSSYKYWWCSHSLGDIAGRPLNRRSVVPSVYEH